MKFKRTIHLLPLLTLALLVLPSLALDSAYTFELPPPSDLSLSDLNGRVSRLSDFKGKVVLLNFWATWCVPCKEEIPEFVGLHRDYKEKGLEIIGVALDPNAEKVPPFVRQYGITYPVLLGNSATVEQWGIRGIPMTFVVNQKGKIVEYYNGPVKRVSLEKVIRQLLDIYASP